MTTTPQTASPGPAAGHWRRLGRQLWAMGAPTRTILVVLMIPWIVWAIQFGMGEPPWTKSPLGPALSGFTSPAPAWGASTIDHSFQQSVEKRFEQAFPLTRFFIRFNNELDYRLLAKSRMYYGMIAIGRGGQLYEQHYIDEHYGYRRRVPDMELRRVAQDLARLRDALAAHGIALAVVGTPDKVSAVPEGVPGWFRKVDAGERAYPRLARVLEAEGVPFHDGRGAAVAFGTRHGPLFPRGGTHWTKLGAYAALEETMAALLRQQTSEEGRVVLGPVEHLPRARGEDVDLLSLLNLFKPDNHYGSDVPELVLEGKPLEKPIVLLGSSFTGGAQWVLERAGIAPSVFRIQYLDREFTCHACVIEPLRKDWVEQVVGASAVIVEVNETVFFNQPYEDDYTRRFIEAVVERLGRP